MATVGSAPSAPDESLRRSEVLCYVADIDVPVLTEEDRHHLVDVLRLRVGDTIALGNGQGAWRSAKVSALPVISRRARKSMSTGQDLELLLGANVIVTAQTEPLLTVAFAIPKGDRLDLVVQKLTELGIDNIVPLITRRTIVKIPENEMKRRTERLVRIAQEASSQSRRLHLPHVSEPMTLENFLVTAPIGTAFAEPGGASADRQVHCVITGPEGGWDEEELSVDIARVGLGPTILRAETAAITAGVLMQAMRSGVVAHE
jgi:16S rRNA (uracil1498-N3)-methyltransferase